MRGKLREKVRDRVRVRVKKRWRKGKDESKVPACEAREASSPMKQRDCY